MKVSIIGCGYSGRLLARRLVVTGHEVVATSTTDDKLEGLSRLGAQAMYVGRGDVTGLSRAVEGADAVVYLAPPSGDLDEYGARTLAGALRRACSDDLQSFVYGSSTGAFGAARPDGGWIDETTEPVDPPARGLRRLLMERALCQSGLPVKILRIAGIYGPGRTLATRIKEGSFVVWEGGPVTSRIHVIDLARLLEASLAPDAPELVVACDERPAPTLDVVRYTAELIGVEPPEPMTFEAAKARLSPIALQMRTSGRRCRSLRREALIGPLEYPTYEEGVRAALEVEKLTGREP